MGHVMTELGTRGKAFRARQVKRPRAQVEEQLKRAILHGRFKQGERLPPETELAHQFGISRPTLREALGSLAKAGLIRKVPGVSGGNFVNSVTPDSLSEMLSDSMSTILRLGSLDVDEVNEVLRLLELPATRWAAENSTPADIVDLRRVIEQQPTGTHDQTVVVNDLLFHAAIGRVSRNRLLAALLSAVHDVAHWAQYLGTTGEAVREMIEQHASILAAIEDGDADDAASLMARHLDFVLAQSALASDTEES
jgi:GntR family transcriptional regulator, transcriptional repressor for pyruvate dehydrogenase complex